MHLKKGISCIDSIILGMAFLFYGTLYPAFWNYFLLGSGSTTVFFQLIFLFLWFVAVLIKRKRSLCVPNTKLLAFLLVSSLYYVIHSIVTGDNIAYIITYIEAIIAIILSHNSFDKGEFMKYIIWFNVVMVLSNAIGTFLAYMGIIEPLGQGINMERDYAIMQNYGLFFVKSSTDWDSIILRGSGFYDEPGSLSFVIFLLLSYNKLHKKSRFIENVLLIGGLFTLSAAHIILSALYILFFYVKKGNRQILILLFLVVGVIWFSKLETDNKIIEQIKYASFGRVERIADGTDASRDFDTSKKAFIHFFPIGTSIEKIKSTFPGASSDTLWFFMARFGLLGTVILFFPLLYLIGYYIRRTGIFSDEGKLLFLLALNCYQRPNLYAPLYITIIYFTWYMNNKISNNKLSRNDSKYQLSSNISVGSTE